MAQVVTGGPGPVVEPTVERSLKPGYRADVEGLRALAILMVAVYHVWVGRVSGGVDIFLMISGYFVGASLVRGFVRGAPPPLWPYLRRIFGRLIPPAVVVLATVLLVTFVLLPRTSMTVASRQGLASMFYVENWYLATSGQAYGAADAAQTPFQHFWSLSVQGQLYVLMPIVLIGATVLLRSRVSRRLYLGLVVALLLTSFVYAVVLTQIDQAAAYYDTFARAWQYLLGTVLAFVAVSAPVARLTHRTRTVLAVVGVVMILGTGVLVDGRALFPGPAALLPLLGAAAVLLAGTGTRPTAVTRALSWRPLVVAGGYAYPFYLWHWPVLVLTIALFGLPDVGWAAGSAILLVSAALAWGTQQLVRQRTRVARRAIDAPRRRLRVTRGALVSGFAIMTVVAGSLSWTTYMAYQRHAMDTAGQLDPMTFPGGRTLFDPDAWPTVDGVTPEPSSIMAQLDWPTAGHDECWTSFEDSFLSGCTFGPPDGDRRIALVGGSHSMSFLLPLVGVAEERSLRVDTYFKQGCPLRLEVDDNSTCEAWSVSLIDKLIGNGYDAVVVTGTRPVDDGIGDYVPPAYLRAWMPLLDAGITVVAIRDNPWLPFNGPECIESAGGVDECSVEESLVLTSTNPLDGPVMDNMLLLSVDMSDMFCWDGECRTVIGNVQAYLDSHHITATYSRTLVPVMDDRLGSATGWW